jgi:hypothetical protein
MINEEKAIKGDYNCSTFLLYFRMPEAEQPDGRRNNFVREESPNTKGQRAG